MGGGERLGERGEARGCEIVRMCAGVCVCTCVDDGEGEGWSEICNALLHQAVYCCNVSCVAL